LRPKWERTKSKGLVEVDRAWALGVHDDREYGDGAAGSQDAVDRIGQEQLADTLPPHLLGTRQPTDQGGWDRIVTRQLVSDLLRQIPERQGQRAQTIKTDHSRFGAGFCVKGNKHPRDMSFLILTGTVPEPVIQIRLTAGEPRSIMMLAERLDHHAQGGSAQYRSIATQRRHKLLGRLGRIQQGIEKSFPVCAEERHPFVLFENPPSPLIGEITSRQPRDSHRALDELLGGGGNTQLNAFSFELPLDRLLASIC
jgi:hypothetical protein